MNSQSDAAPNPHPQRLHLIDALRGFALAGVLMVNLGMLSLYDYLDDGARAALPTADFDRIALAAMHMLVENKAATLFTLLFGLGFSLQMDRAHGPDAVRRYLRRLAALALIGAAHAYLLWWGDILLIYALLAVLLFPFRHASDRVLLYFGLFTAIVLPALLTPLIEPLVARLPPYEALAQANLAAFSSPSFVAALRQNALFGNYGWLAFWGIYCFVLGRFLLGYWAGRRGLLHRPAENRRTLRALCATGLLLGGALTYVNEANEFRLLEQIPGVSSPVVSFVKILLQRIAPLALGIGYAAGFALIYLRPRGQRLLNVLAPVGRMALTNYLMQTVVCQAFFYGYGAGFGPRYGLVGWLAAWAVLFAAQIAMSRWWLSRFRFGPMEWLWRSVTYGSRQPMKIQSPSPQNVPCRSDLPA